MDPAPGLTSKGVLFEDALGQRRPIADPNGADTLEVLCLRPELTSVSSFEFALRERVARLTGFRHAFFARVRGVERLKGGSTLALVSERLPGVRLSEVIAHVEQQHLTLDINSALSLIRQLVPAVALLHENVRDVAHGAIGLERLVLTPNARLIVVEHVLGAALEQLRLTPDQYWRDLRIPVARSTAVTRFDHRTDVLQIGIVALELVIGRRLKADEYPSRLPEVVASAWAISASGGLEPLPPGLRSWLMRALQLEPRGAFASALDARAELDKMLGAADYSSAPQALELFVAKLQASGDPDRVDAPAAPPAPQVEERVVSTSIPSSAPTASYPERAQPALAAIPLTAPAAVMADQKDDEEEPVEAVIPPRAWWQQSRVLAAAAAMLVLVSGGFVGRRYLAPGAVGTGALNVNSNPAGAQVLVDGERQGVTPVNLVLKAGPHLVELRGTGEPRSIPIVIAPGSQASQYIELPKEKTLLGQIQITTEPASAQVTLDGVLRGRSPLMISDVTPGVHAVLVESEAGSVKQEVTIEPGVTASLVVPLSTVPQVPASGWIAVTAPVVVQLFESGRLLGSSESDRIMVSSGRHDIEIVNEPLAYRSVRAVQVVPGKVVPIKIELPKQKIALNAVPWAEVWIDGDKIGETPIGDFSIAAGPHEIVFRHPELGEQRHAITVTTNAPARLSVDMRKK